MINQRATTISRQTPAPVPTVVTLVLCLAAAVRAAEPSGTPDADGVPEATTAEATETSPDEAIQAQLEALQQAICEGQDAQDAQEESDQPPIVSSYLQRQALRSERRQARLEQRRNVEQLALEKAKASHGQGATTAIGAHENLGSPQVQAMSNVPPAPPGPRPLPEPTLFPGALADISITFHLENGSAPNSQMAEHWVPRISGVMDGEFTVVAMVEGHDAEGWVIDINPEWIPADPSMVAVSPRNGRTVKITVRGAGASNLTVTASGVSKDLWISAAPDQRNAMKVEILQ